jgi:hypothetical protein
MTEFNNIREMGHEKLGELWTEHGRHVCGLNYVGLEYMVRVRYIGDTVPLHFVSGLMSDGTKTWMKEVGYKGRYATMMDLSYAYGWTRKGSVVRINEGLPLQFATIQRDLKKATLNEVRKYALKHIDPQRFRGLGLNNPDVYSGLA